MLLLVPGGFGLKPIEAYPGWRRLACQVEHAGWEGCTFWDQIQTAFTFAGLLGRVLRFTAAVSGTIPAAAPAGLAAETVPAWTRNRRAPGAGFMGFDASRR